MTGALTIGVVVGVTPDKWVRVWRERMADVPLRIVPVEAEDAATALADGADMVFTRLPVSGDAEALHVIPLWEETPMVVAAKDHPVKVFDAVVLSDLADEQRHEGWDDAVLDIVAAGHGVAVVPQSVFRATGRRDLVARPVSDAEPTRIALVWRRDAPDQRVPLLEEFIGVVRGRTANSSRGAAEVAPDPAPQQRAQPSRTASKARRQPVSPAARRPRRPNGRGRG